MKRRILIHGGLPKCGSTSLQFVLASNRPALEARGVFYPDPQFGDDLDDLRGEGREDTWTMSHMGLAAALARDSGPDATRLPCERLAATMALFAATPCPMLMLSSESFIMRARRLRAAAFGDLFDPYDVELLLFFRRYDKWVLSFYKQCVKGKLRRYTGTFDEFVAAPPPYAQMVANFDLAQSAALLQGVTGAQMVHLYDLDAARSDTRTITGEMIGLPIRDWPVDPALLKPRNQALLAAGLPINESLSDARTLFLARVNLGTMTPDAREAVLVALSSIELDPTIEAIRILSPAASATLLARNATNQRKLRDRFGAGRVDPAPDAPRDDIRFAQMLTTTEWLGIAGRVEAVLDEATRAEFLSIVALVRPDA